MPKVGDLNKRLRVMARTDVQDRVGGIGNTPTLLATLWAKVSPVNASGTYEEGRMESSRTHEVTFRSNEVVKPGQMLQMPQVAGQPARYLRVMATRRVREREWWLVCDCEEKDTWP